jgi:hypothetical protein
MPSARLRLRTCSPRRRTRATNRACQSLENHIPPFELKTCTAMVFDGVTVPSCTVMVSVAPPSIPTTGVGSVAS